MNKANLMPLLKYYKGEEAPPDAFNPVQSLWWEGERSLVGHVENDDGFYNRLLTTYREALENNAVSGILADKKIDENKRAIVYYLDIWHGQYYPYDSLDLIYQY